MQHSKKALQTLFLGKNPTQIKQIKSETNKKQIKKKQKYIKIKIKR